MRRCSLRYRWHACHCMFLYWYVVASQLREDRFQRISTDQQKAYHTHISLTILNLVPSLYGFFEAIKLLEAWANCLKWVVHLGARDTVSSALVQSDKFYRASVLWLPCLFMVVHKWAGREGTHHAATCTWAKKDNPAPVEP